MKNDYYIGKEQIRDGRPCIDIMCHSTGMLFASIPMENTMLDNETRLVKMRSNANKLINALNSYNSYQENN